MDAGRIGILPAGNGPQSAIITGPGIERPIELIDSTVNPDLVAKLMEHTGLCYAIGDLPRPLEQPAYTLTWINSGPLDNSIDERTIRQLIYLDAENGPVIHTPVQDSLQGWGPGMIGWFAAPNGLRDTLTGLGVPVSGETSSVDPAFAETASGMALPDRESSSTFWFLSIVGFALVVGLARFLAARSALKRKIPVVLIKRGGENG